MKYIKFEIDNFKGIRNIVLDLDTKLQGKIFPLVGLNESGKTTILEAIHWLFDDKIYEDRENELIHKKDISNFNGTISVKATLLLEDKDKQFIKKFLRENNLEMENEIEQIEWTRSYTFESSQFIKEKSRNVWRIPVRVKNKEKDNFVLLDAGYKEQWKTLVERIQNEYLPHILYFENFLFNFPHKIYLEANNASQETDSSIQRQYRSIIQDILSTIDPKDNLNIHILDRLKDPNEPNLMFLQGTLGKMNDKLNSVIIDSWQSIFPDNPPKEITVSHGNDSNGYFLRFQVREGSEFFNIGERSLGFRWFFGFLLFTEFRKSRTGEEGEYLFLFDEPASNLHTAAQQKLLSLFDKIVSNAKIIYSTHSHYLLNSKSLLTSLVVRDKGRDVSQASDWRKYSQDISATLYKNIPKDQSQQSDFQPILDTLEYIENPFIKTENVVFFEGKNDYYTFQWICKFFGEKEYNFGFHPGAGAGNYDNIFREYLAHQRTFIAIFDDDDEGEKQKSRYIEKVSCELKNTMFTLKDVSDHLSGFKTEDLFTDEEKLRLRQKAFFESEIQEVDNEPEEKIRENKIKSQINMGVQKLFCNEQKIELSQKTLNNFETIFNFIDKKFKELEKENNAPN